MTRGIGHGLPSCQSACLIRVGPRAHRNRIPVKGSRTEFAMEHRMVRTCVVGVCVSVALILLSVGMGARSASASDKDVIVINDAANPVPVTGTVVVSAQAPVQRFQNLISAN